MELEFTYFNGLSPPRDPIPVRNWQSASEVVLTEKTSLLEDDEANTLPDADLYPSPVRRQQRTRQFLRGGAKRMLEPCLD